MDTRTRIDCYHCSLPVPLEVHQELSILGVIRKFCCAGCLSVAQLINDNQLTDYYRLRTKTAQTPVTIDLEELLALDNDGFQSQFVEQSETNLSSVRFLSEAIRCSACAWLLERKLGSLDGIDSVRVSVADQSIGVAWDEHKIQLSEIARQCQLLGYPVVPFQNGIALDSLQNQQKNWLKRLGLAGLGMMQVMMYAIALYIGAFDGIETGHRDLLRWVSFIVATPVLLYCAKPFYSSAFASLRSSRLNMDVPITVAIFLTYGASIMATVRGQGEVYFDSVTMFIFLLLAGRFLEFRARYAITKQMLLKESTRPLFVIRLDSGRRELVPIEQVQEGDELLVKSGEMIALDGILSSESASIEEAAVSGEFMPVSKSQGERLLAGTVNTDQPLVMKASGGVSDSYWSQLQKLQEAAVLEKPALVLLADRVAGYFVFAVLMVALATFAFWYLQDSPQALWITVSVLVASCPCALSLATPVAFTCSVTALNRAQTWIKKQNFLHQLSSVTDVVLDKTGTLTKGELRIERVTLSAVAQERELTESEVLAMIAALETGAEHPIAEAFQEYATAEVQADDILVRVGAGVAGTINQHHFLFGNSLLLRDSGIDSSLLNDDDGLFLVCAGELLASITLADTLRSDASELVKRLAEGGYRLHLVSGDRSSQVQKVAKKLGIINWHWGMLPKQKLGYVQALQQRGKQVLLVGDGVNDAPVMAGSDTAITLAEAPDLAQASADCYLLSNRLTGISDALAKALATRRVIKQNLFWAGAYNLTFVPFAAAGLVSPYLAAVGMSLSSIVVMLNSLRLARRSASARITESPST